MTGHGQQRPCALSRHSQAHPKPVPGAPPPHTFFTGDFSVTALPASLLLFPVSLSHASLGKYFLPIFLFFSPLPSLFPYVWKLLCALRTARCPSPQPSV